MPTASVPINKCYRHNSASKEISIKSINNHKTTLDACSWVGRCGGVHVAMAVSKEIGRVKMLSADGPMLVDVDPSDDGEWRQLVV